MGWAQHPSHLKEPIGWKLSIPSEWLMNSTSLASLRADWLRTSTTFASLRADWLMPQHSSHLCRTVCPSALKDAITRSSLCLPHANNNFSSLIPLYNILYCETSNTYILICKMLILFNKDTENNYGIIPKLNINRPFREIYSSYSRIFSKMIE